MKKLILILCLIFALTLCFVACDERGDTSNEGQSPNALPAGAPKTEDPTSKDLTSEEPTSEDITTDEKTFQELSTNNKKSSKLRFELITFLRLKHGFVDPVMGDLASQLERNLYWGKYITRVQFDPSNYYFVCGYYNCEHADENKWYDCVDKYTWIIVENEHDIPEYYNDLKFIVAFQINKALSATDISSGYYLSTEIEHYLEYKPEFVDGKNVAKELNGNISYIYFVSPSDEYIIDSINDYFHETYTLSCIELDGKWYVCVKNSNLEIEFGQYYNALIEIAEEYENYVILEFNAFADAVLK